MNERHEKGFTLIELFIIMLIVSIMAGLAVPKMGLIFAKNRLRSSTSSVTSSLYLARMKAVNDGIKYGVQFFETGEFYVIRDSLGTNVGFGALTSLEEGISFDEITFMDWCVIFNEYGQLEKTCLPEGDLNGNIVITSDTGDTTSVEVTFVTGRIRETNL